MQKPLILIVEDDESSFQVIEYHLSRYRLIWTQTGKDATKIIEQKKADIDIILLDMGLPDISGIEVLKYAKRHRIKAKVIVITANKAFESVKKCLKMGAFYYVAKDENLDMLPFLIKSALAT